VALHVGDVATAERAAASLEPTLGGATDADLAVIRAGIAAARGRTGEALAGYRTALAAYRELGLAFDIALTGFDMAALLGDAEPAAVAAAAEAREILVGLGAVPLVARLDRARLTGNDQASAGRPDARPVRVMVPDQPPTRLVGELQEWSVAM
jgi:hypothetical protein